MEGREGRKEREGETGRAESNPSSSYCKRSATENSKTGQDRHLPRGSSSLWGGGKPHSCGVVRAEAGMEAGWGVPSTGRSSLSVWNASNAGCT